MSLRKIEKSEYSSFIEFAKCCSANHVYPMSIVERYQEGDIYIDQQGDAGIADYENVRAVMFWHYCGFVYLAGSPSKALLEEIYEEFLSRNQERRFIIITDDEAIKDFFSKKSDVIIDKRFEYEYDVSDSGAEDLTENSEAEDSTKVLKQNPDDNSFKYSSEISIERISEENIDRIHGRIIPSFSWDASTAFLEKGLGYVAADGEKIAAVAFSSAVSSDEIDIGVETDPDYRRRGLSALLAAKMCEEIIKLGKKPVWAHAAANVASGKTAERAGFVKTKENYVIRKS